MKVITLSREYGAGGHTIGKAVAKKLNIPFYDKDIIRNAAKASGIELDLVEEEGEDMSKIETIMTAISNLSSGYYNDTHEKLVEIQKAIIINYAKQGPCVILGRCADDILLTAGIDCINVFIYADELHRAKRIAELIGTDDVNQVRKAMLKRDEARHNYFHHFTGKKWGFSSNYHICLDSGFLGYDKCTDIIVDIAKDQDNR